MALAHNHVDQFLSGNQCLHGAKRGQHFDNADEFLSIEMAGNLRIGHGRDDGK